MVLEMAFGEFDDVGAGSDCDAVTETAEGEFGNTGAGIGGWDVVDVLRCCEVVGGITGVMVGDGSRGVVVGGMIDVDDIDCRGVTVGGVVVGTNTSLVVSTAVKPLEEHREAW